MRLLGRVQHSICTGFVQCADDNRLCRHAVQREGCGNTLPANRTAADRLRYRGRLQPASSKSPIALSTDQSSSVYAFGVSAQIMVQLPAR